MDKFLVLGGNSKLAKCFSNLFPKLSKNIVKKRCDITDKFKVDKLLKKTKAKYILNCAAITDIEKCEKNKKLCLEVNTIAVENLEKIALKYNKKLIHITSDYALHPKNYYGYTKFLNEKNLNKNKTLIIRTSFYSKDYYIIKNLFNNKEVVAFKNMYFNPVSINKVAELIYQNKKKAGILNIFSSKKISKFEFALKVCEVFDKEKIKVSPGIFKNKEGFAYRPLDSYVKSDIKILLEKDLREYKRYLLSNNLL